MPIDTERLVQIANELKSLNQNREKLLAETPIERIMPKEPLTIAPGTSLAEAIRIMLEKKVGGLPVVEHRKLVGLITQGDLLRAFLDRLDAEK